MQYKKLYVGFSADLKSRLDRHNKKMVPSTRPYTPWQIIFFEAYLNKNDALRREKYLKTSKGKTTIRSMLREYFIALN